MSSMLPKKQEGFFRANGLTIALLALFASSAAGQFLSGRLVYNEERAENGEPAVSYGEYLCSGHFLEALFENWESEFLQMAAFIVLTISLRQIGSSESKGKDPEEVDRDPRLSVSADSPWPVHQGGLILKVYEHSLTIALVFLFVASFALHLVEGAAYYNEQQLAHGKEVVSIASYFVNSQFWFESLQNWQSEFLSVAVLVVLSIVLRQRGSPQSKPVHAPHSQTGEG